MGWGVCTIYCHGLRVCVASGMYYVVYNRLLIVIGNGYQRMSIFTIICVNTLSVMRVRTCISASCMSVWLISPDLGYRIFRVVSGCSVD